ncbi:MAG: transcriptional repressor [Clostridiales bacterium]|jgi:Fur family peroxide stress response transcriptional regulator|nr:transcriptional repressor [Clostridiales bacterium]
MIRRNTKQKEAVKAELKRLGHPTAEELYTALRDKYPEMSKATVYRNLRILEENNAIIRVIGAIDGGERFDADMRPHYHFICLKCGLTADIDDGYMKSADVGIEEKFGYKVVGHRTNFFGYCGKCKE